MDDGLKSIFDISQEELELILHKNLHYNNNMNFFEENVNENNNNLIEIFEKIANEPSKYNYLRQCRFMMIPFDLNKIEPGQYCEILTEGGGYLTQWYYYKSLKSKHMLIFETKQDEKKRYTGREIDKIPTNSYNCSFYKPNDFLKKI